jgi:hypothetical protein
MVLKIFSTNSLGVIYLNAQPRVFKSQGRLMHPLGNKTRILRDISFNLWLTNLKFSTYLLLAS